MKNVFMYAMFILGTMFIIGGVVKFFPFEIKIIETYGESYKYGHMAGYVIGKFFALILGAKMIQYGYETYQEIRVK
ncbi:hypothetical protein KBJ98_03670 [Flavobacterium sp. F-328]|jgi:hypothetical protein|uniref:Uncharacterized protein n=1 Tax=Flavobacterium erciyesense TaxID=2825842 RepID=A0ABS5D1A4_9FLAO|nr:hypothetical protein [Flavobacterium erciyesense]MBQ0907798.1 hypothetical protein [Flavobacterium erciyesense]